MSRKIMAFLEIATAVGLLLFWTAFFTIGLAPESPPPGYFVYEHSFPLPDGILAIGLLAAGYASLKNLPWAAKASFICAGGLIFLGVVDFSFNIQNGMYAISPVDTVLNAFINIWSVGLGILIIAFYGD